MTGGTEMTLPDDFENAAQTWCAQKRAEGKVIGSKGLYALFGHPVSKRWVSRMIKLRFVAVERSPWGGLFAFWLLESRTPTELPG